MTPIEKAAFQMHAELDDYKDRIEASQGLIAEALDRANKPYIAYSGGKDSLVMLHMVLRVCPEVLVEHFYFGKYYFPMGLETEILGIAGTIGAKNIRVDTSSKYDLAGRTSKNIYFPEMFGRVQPDLISKGYDLAFIGLRREESGKRKRKASEPFRWNGKMLECYPLMNLTARDVWTYIVSNDLPYCSHYDRYGALLGIENTRMSTLFDPEFYKLGSNNIDGVLMPGFKNL